MPSSHPLVICSDSNTSVVDSSDCESVKSSPGRQRRAHGAQSKYGRRTSSSRYRSPSPNYETRARHTYSHREATPKDHNECIQRYGRLEQKYEALKAKYVELSTAHTTLTTAHESLTRAVGSYVANGGSSSSVSSTSPPSELTFTIPEKYQNLSRQNATTRFPLIKFWTQRDFSKSNKKENQDGVLDSSKGKAQRGSARLKDGENVSCQFLEEEDGSIVDGHVAEAIRKHLQLIFKEMGPRLPETWGKVGIVDRSYVLEQLYMKYPYLLLCFDDWKADFLAGRGLSSFRSTEKRRTVRAETTVKAEVKDQDQEDLLLIDEKTGIKRKALTPEPGAVDAKKPRLMQGLADPPPSKLELHNAAPRNSTSPQPRSLAPPSSPSTSPPLGSAPMPAIGPSLSSFSVTHATEPQPTASAPAPIPSRTVNVPHSNPVMAANPSVLPEGTQGFVPLTPHIHSTSTSTTEALPDPVTADATASAPMVAPLLSTTQCETSTASSAPKHAPIINPINKIFGPSVAPTARLDSLRAAQEELKAKSAAMKEPPLGSTVTEGTAKTQNTLAHAASGPFKKVTTSNSAKNLCYQEYLKDNAPLTPADFEKYWKGLPRETTKGWNEKSKSKKSPNGMHNAGLADE